MSNLHKATKHLHKAYRYFRKLNELSVKDLKESDDFREIADKFNKEIARLHEKMIFG